MQATMESASWYIFAMHMYCEDTAYTCKTTTSLSYLTIYNFQTWQTSNTVSPAVKKKDFFLQ